MTFHLYDKNCELSFSFITMPVWEIVCMLSMWCAHKILVRREDHVGFFDKNPVWMDYHHSHICPFYKAVWTTSVSKYSYLHSTWVPVIVVTSWGTDVLVLPSQFMITELKSSTLDQWWAIFWAWVIIDNVFPIYRLWLRKQG